MATAAVSLGTTSDPTHREAVALLQPEAAYVGILAAFDHPAHDTLAASDHHHACIQAHARPRAHEPPRARLRVWAGHVAAAQARRRVVPAAVACTRHVVPAGVVCPRAEARRGGRRR